MSNVSKTLYKPLALGISILGGMAAGAVFNKVWAQFSDEPDAPNPKDLQRSTREVLAAAALQGLIYGVVKAAIDRAGAQGYKAVTHETPE
ncbi:DUF4235 domain-containing protein [Gordonia sp. Z-3]|jgi:hypothetical protein|uniref:DUF4235 domain-containing protein n=1 Tax=Gordonia tangerina TaxID=2911060 RepID=A0ABS9DJB0_9ACTN|nr:MULTISPECIES: DUF4235 domain-containing protein [Gordonia]MAU81469.1 hypothetical protein [Gordonia sp. (in: high G+C Gram-positive bacteria)]MCF3939312.1 DUF4235 domain-containing protein [Gordonia tangerina]MED5802138.1 DUF4235 domain-containing protein [Gordonia sp. Z-3]